MQEQDFLIKKYEYDTVYKLELEARLREENTKYQEAKDRIQRKNNDFEKVRNNFINKKNLETETKEGDLKFLQKRLFDKSKDIEKNKKIVKDLEQKTDALLNKLNKSKKSLEFIYKKIEDIKLKQKIKKENIETSENIETFIVNKRFKDLLNKSNSSEKVSNVGDEKDNKRNFDVDIQFEKDAFNDIAFKNFDSQNLSVDANSKGEGQNNQRSENVFNTFNEHQGNENKNSYLSFEKFKERIDSLNVQNFENGSSISLNYTSESGNQFYLNFTECAKQVDINVEINSYKDYLNFHNEKSKILASLKDKGINIRNIIVRNRA